MLKDIENVALEYYTQEMIDYNIYGILHKIMKPSRMIIQFKRFMPKNIFYKYQKYIADFKCSGENIYFVYETPRIEFTNHNSNVIPRIVINYSI